MVLRKIQGVAREMIDGYRESVRMRRFNTDWQRQMRWQAGWDGDTGRHTTVMRNMGKKGVV